jgi:hypothetical protein
VKGAGRAVWHLMRADYLERVRRHSFLVTLGITVWFAYISLPPNHSRYVTMQLSGSRGLYNSAWVGMVAGLLTSVFLSIAGFYVVKNTVARDRDTGVGEILATTPLSRPIYTLGKAASNFAVLATMVLVVAAAAAGMQLVRGEDRHLELVALFGPAVFATLPAMAVVAALAVLFETVPWLAGGLGNVCYFFFAMLGMMAPSTGVLEHGRSGNDVLGMGTMIPSVFAAHSAAWPGEPARPRSFSMGFNIQSHGTWDLRTFRWQGVRWSVATVASRLLWVGAAIGIALGAAIPFDRFDPARRRRERRARPDAARSPPVGIEREEIPAEAGPAAMGDSAGARAEALPAAPLAPSLARLAVAELRLMLRGVPKLWGIVVAGLVVAEVFAPLDIARGMILPAAWVWPLLVWSSMGSREERHRTAPLLHASPHPLAFQMPAVFLAGLAIAMLLGLPVAVRLALAGDGIGLGACTAGAAFVPALALALGVWSGSGKLFEILYLALWYLGPVNRVPVLDFFGFSRASAAAGAWMGFAAAAVVLYALAVWGRSRQLAR